MNNPQFQLGVRQKLSRHPFGICRFSIYAFVYKTIAAADEILQSALKQRSDVFVGFFCLFAGNKNSQ
jgi:hypothetical protein